MSEPTLPSASFSNRGDSALQTKSQSSNSHEQKRFENVADFLYNQQKQKLGWIGWFFGADKEKAGNIACISIAFSLLLIPFIIFMPINDQNVSKDRFLIFPSNIITLSLGYLFGRKFL